MKKCRIGILLLAIAIALLNFALVGCRKNRDQETTTTTESGSPLLPSPGATLPGENGESPTDTTEETRIPNESESMTETAKQDVTTTTKQETTNKVTETTTSKQETTTKKPETTTSKQETTTKKPETTTSKQETTTKVPETTTKVAETTTTKQETPTKVPETTTSKQETTTKATETTTSDNHPILPGESITLPIPGPDESETSHSTGSATQSEGTTVTQTENEPNVPESGAGEWLHFEAFTEDHLGAAAYLGQSAQELAVTEIIARLGLSLTEQDITVIDNGDSEDTDGDEWYLIIPRYRDTVIRLYDAETENSKSTAGELLAEGMHPMLVRCDPEDGDPSVYVELIRGEEKVTFPLREDKEPGKPMFHDSILNITPEPSGRMRKR